MALDTHPRSTQRYREKTRNPPVAGVPNFRCVRCNNQIFQFNGRKKHPAGGFVCAYCVAESEAASNA